MHRLYGEFVVERLEPVELQCSGNISVLSSVRGLKRRLWRILNDVEEVRVFSTHCLRLLYRHGYDIPMLDWTRERSERCGQSLVKLATGGRTERVSDVARDPRDFPARL